MLLTIACWPVGVTGFIIRSQQHKAKYKELDRAYSVQQVTARLEQRIIHESVSSLEHSSHSLKLQKMEVEKLLKACRGLREQCQDIVNKLQASRISYSEMVMQCSLAANNIVNSKLVATRPRTMEKIQDALEQLFESLALTEQDRAALLGKIEARGSRRVLANRALS